MTTEPHARALKRGAMGALMDALASADSPEDFLAAADSIVANPSNQLRLPVDPAVPEELEAGPAGANGRDVNNSHKVYEFLGVMDRANASDGRLWTFLAFSTYRAYMEERWPLNVPSWKNRVIDRWLLTGTTRGRLVRHGIARLWWVAELTFDGDQQYPLSVKLDDPFAYAKAVFKNEDRVINIFDREAGAVPSVVRAVIEHAESSPKHGTDTNIRRLMKEMTLVCGFRDVELLGAEGLSDLVVSFEEPESVA